MDELSLWMDLGLSLVIERAILIDEGNTEFG
jgi:hypothetical protein